MELNTYHFHICRSTLGPHIPLIKIYIHVSAILDKELTSIFCPMQNIFLSFLRSARFTV